MIKSNKEGLVLFGVVTLFSLGLSLPAFGFTLISNFGKPARWLGNEVEYHFQDVPADFKDPIRTSFLSWTILDGVDLTFNESKDSGEAGSRDGRNTIAWVSEDWDGLYFNPPSNALAVTLSSFDSSTGAIVDADIYFNAETFSWADIQDPEVEGSFVDVRNIATHEIGHMLGLDHSSVNFFESDPELYEATMYYASGAGEIRRRTPKDDDRWGMQSLYPNQAVASATISSVDKIDSTGNVHTYIVTGSNFSENTSFILSTLDGSSPDVVARYRTITSSSEAEIQLNLLGFGSDEATLIAYNGPESLGTYNLKTGITSQNFNSGSGGGGGCSLQTKAEPLSSLFILGLSLIMLATLALRRKPCRVSA